MVAAKRRVAVVGPAAGSRVSGRSRAKGNSFYRGLRWDGLPRTERRRRAMEPGAQAVAGGPLGSNLSIVSSVASSSEASRVVVSPFTTLKIFMPLASPTLQVATFALGTPTRVLAATGGWV